uniref:NADH-ubiquinone oxidoreductase chain 5 n=1 Tax=Jesogammarus hinumensis TaxID=378308 RepID=A0A891ZKE0_9CRUS|nr:NADH dehydrogenase subunit 5 [Jesogammarus hinumensis]QRN71583.1 NADH dehydrogenase subunit 5 [Jesogammarus hinumensis]
MKLSNQIYFVFAMSLMVISFFFFFCGFFCAIGSTSYFIEWDLLSLSGVSVVFSLIFDWMSFVFLGSVCLISSCIMKYSYYYMHGEKNMLRFVFIMLFFVGSMNILIVSPNLVSILLGWDGLGLTSYALVIFYQSESSCNGGMITVISNRIGDVSILMGISVMFVSGGWNFLFDGGYLAGFFVVLASCTKSAQMPFSAWLPAAMAAPTPVSALVHSSTLVTAGVYLLIRFNKIVMDSGLSDSLLMISVMTMVMAGLSANFETDMKKIIALSTLSQLGLMVMVLSSGEPELAYFHMIVHAMFKSSLFMCAGFMIHNISGSQDTRNMSGFMTASPLLMSVFSCLNMALSGFPFLAGFYSKDLILESMWENNLNLILVSAVVLATGLTVSYSFRLIFLANSSVSNLQVVSGSQAFNLVVFKSVFFLFSASVVFGFFFFWLFSGIFIGSITTSLNKYYILLAMSFSSIISYCLFSFSGTGSVEFKAPGLKEGAMDMWFIGFFSTKFVSRLILVSGWRKIKLLENGWLEYYGGQGGRSLFLAVSSYSQLGQKSILVSSYLVFCGISLVLVNLIF